MNKTTVYFGLILLLVIFVFYFRQTLTLSIFKSINFKDSDTLINSNEFEFIENKKNG